MAEGSIHFGTDIEDVYENVTLGGCRDADGCSWTECEVAECLSHAYSYVILKLDRVRSLLLDRRAGRSRCGRVSRHVQESIALNP